jgi:hypothetical protein
MSLRPAGENMDLILANFRGDPMIYTMTVGMKLPKEFCVFHEHTDHYSLQTTEDVGLEEFNRRLTEFLRGLPVQSREAFIQMRQDLDDQDN